MEQQHVAVLGGGLVGGFIAEQLAGDPTLAVTLYDHDRELLRRRALQPRLRTVQLDLSSPRHVKQAAHEASLVVGALPGHLGYQSLQAVLEAGRDTVDISFFPESPNGLRQQATDKGVTAVVDCGVMPGLGGMLAVHFAQRLAKAEHVTIMVGGLPEERRWPLQYKAPFSPADVIEEYTRPARLVEYGRLVTKPALSEVELVELPGVGTLEAFNTDGLRTLLETLKAPHMKEKTLRYPGHAEQMRLLRELGFFDAAPLELHGQSVAPLAVSSALLFKHWRYTPGERELTVMRVEVEGSDAAGKQLRCRADLLDRTDDAGNLSMARTTGWPAIIAARMLLRGQLAGRGLLPAELLGEDEALFDVMVDELGEAGIDIHYTTEAI
jgi:lysine 6-dehydrogenase